jgi:hypothetical protein
MDSNDKAASVLELLQKKPACTNLSYRNSEGLHEFMAERAGVTHWVCYPDDVLNTSKLEELAAVAASVFDLLRAEDGPARVVIRSGIFRTMLTQAVSP